MQKLIKVDIPDHFGHVTSRPRLSTYLLNLVGVKVRSPSVAMISESESESEEITMTPDSSIAKQTRGGEHEETEHSRHALEHAQS